MYLALPSSFILPFHFKIFSFNCIQCPQLGYYSADNVMTCIPCPAGRYAGTFNATKCLACPSTVHPPLFFYFIITFLIEELPFRWSGGQSNYQLAQSHCTPCPSGSYADSEGSTNCSPCGSGEYQPGQGQWLCKACLSGKVCLLSFSALLRVFNGTNNKRWIGQGPSVKAVVGLRNQ